jgi:hypothetical protein
MSKFGDYWSGEGEQKHSEGTSLGPMALDATSGLGSNRLSRIPTTLEDLIDYYGGFYPSEDWVDALQPIPLEQRANPQLVTQVESLHRDGIEGLKKSANPYLRVEPNDLVGMAPLRNRIAGNARVMPSTRIACCPTEDGATLTWQPDEPDVIWCPKGHPVDPYKLFPQTGTLEIVGPKGDTQEYPFHDAPDGKRIYLDGEYMDSLRVYYLIEASRTLGLLYQVTGETDYAERAAAITYDFARAVPHWPKTHRGRPGIAEEDRFRPVSEYPVYAGIWYDKYHTGTRHMCILAEGYDFIVNAPVWEALDLLAPGGDARAFIEKELFLYSVKDAIRYDIHYPHPDAALSNYIPYQATGFILVGRGVGVPELVHYAYWKLRLLAEKTIMADYVFPESMSYGGQQIHGIAKASGHGSGYSDPPGFLSSIDGTRFDNMDNRREIPILHNAVETLATMVYPDGNYIQAHDTHHTMRKRKNTDIEETRPSRTPSGKGRSLIYPSFGHAFLARGGDETDRHIQAHLHYSGNWGHDHDDMLNFILWSYGEEMISDIGYQLTYNGFAKTAAGHNLVVVDRNTQAKVSQPGSLVGWHPSPSGLQVLEVSAPEVYPQCSTYRRTLFHIPIGEADNLVLDIFDVEGGSIHEWMAQGSCMAEQSLEVSVPTVYHADSYADDGEPFTPPAHAEWEKELLAQGLKPKDVNPWYGVFRDVHMGSVEEPFTATFRAEDGRMPDVRMHMIDSGKGDLYTCTVPTLRQCWSNALQIEDHSLVEKFRMPKVVIRREGEHLRSRFVTLWEPIRDAEAVDSVTGLTPENSGVVAVEILTTKGNEVQLFYTPDPSVCHDVGDGVSVQGRYASVVTAEESTEITLYDCTRFRYAGQDLTLLPRPALPVVEVGGRDGEDCVVVLDGLWDGFSEGCPIHLAEPELAILTQDGSSGRAFPVRTVESRRGQMLLHCSRHPGFDFEASANQLREVFTPFGVVDGNAEVRIPNRGWVRYDSKRPDVMEARTTGGMRVGDQVVDRCDDWIEVISTTSGSA